MKLSPILSPSGEPMFVAGGPDAWKVTTYRDWVVSLEWYRRRRSYQKCMVIWPATRIQGVLGSKTPGKWCVAFSALTHFIGFTADGKCTGSASPYCYEQCLEALEVMGRDRNDKQSFLSLVDTIIKFGPELVTMPVAPKIVRQRAAGDPMWEVQAKNKSTGKIISEAAV